MKSLSVVFLAASLLLLAGCGRKPEPAAAAGPPVVRDEIKTVDYIALGIPAPNREWSPVDYRNASKVIATLPLDSLPRLGRSGGCFERMVDRKNFSLLRNASLPLDQRMGAADGFMGGLSQVFKVYAMHPYQEHVLGEEVIRIFGAELALISAMLPLMDEFWKSLPEDQRTPVRQEGKRKLIAGLEQTLSGAFVMLGEAAVWTPAQRRTLAENLNECVRQSWPHLSEPFRKELPVRAGERLAAEADAGVGKALKEIQASLAALAAIPAAK